MEDAGVKSSPATRNIHENDQTQPRAWVLLKSRFTQACQLRGQATVTLKQMHWAVLTGVTSDIPG